MQYGAIAEKDFQKDILEVAGLLRWLAYHTYDSRKCVAGFPDLVLVRAPRVIFAELKTEKGTVKAAQKIWLAELGDCDGVENYIWRPSDKQLIIKILK